MWITSHPLSRKDRNASFSSLPCLQTQICSPVQTAISPYQSPEHEGRSNARRHSSLRPDQVACYHPVEAFQTSTGDVVFAERRGHDSVRTLALPCGQCIGCRLERSRQWAVRCMHECSLSDHNCFITLTYDDAHLPPGGSLRYRDFQLFMKRLRRMHPDRRVRFFVAGEYGDKLSRPHYHACLFNFDFADKKVLSRSSRGGHELAISGELSRLWAFGLHSIGAVTFDSAAYVARYCLKKVTGDPRLKELHYGLRAPEFACMSRRPGIGADWFARYPTDVRDGFVVVNGVKARAPRFYDRLLAIARPDDFERVQYERELARRASAADNTDQRLQVRETVTRARLAQKGTRDLAGRIGS
jgi:hypothetical protein